VAGNIIPTRIALAGALISACILFSAVFVVQEAAFAADSISISCYRNNQYVGNINVLRVRGAANACNQVYSACEGECAACFIDYDYIEEVCVDIYGRTYLR